VLSFQSAGCSYSQGATAHSRIRRVGVECAHLLVIRGEAEAVVILQVAGYWLQQHMAGAGGPSGDTTWSLLDTGTRRTRVAACREQMLDALGVSAAE
jgi:hypothetical protein